MDTKSRAYLDDIFAAENSRLKELLEKHSKVDYNYKVGAIFVKKVYACETLSKMGF